MTEFLRSHRVIPQSDRPASSSVRPVKSYAVRKSVCEFADGLGMGVGMLFASEHFPQAVRVGPEYVGNVAVLLALQFQNPRRNGLIEVEVEPFNKNRVHVDPRDGVLHRCHGAYLRVASRGHRDTSPLIAVVSLSCVVQRLHAEERFLGPNRSSPPNSRSIAVIGPWSPRAVCRHHEVRQ